MTLRVLVVAACPFPAGRGSQLLIERTTRGLRERGHRVTLLASRSREPGRPDPFPVERAGLPAPSRRVDSAPSLRRAVDDALILAASLRQAPDVILAHNVEGGLVGGLAGRWLRRPVVWLRHSDFAGELACVSRLPGAARLAGRLAERWADRLATRVVELRAETGEPAERVDAIPPPLDPGEPRVAAGDGSTLYYEGNLDAYQNPAWLDEALRVARLTHPGARLLRAAGPDQRPARADLALVPRTLGGGFPMKLLAAQVAGVAALCTRSGAPGVVDGLDAFVVDGGRERFCARAAELLGRPDLLRRLATTARERALRRSDPARVSALLERSLLRAIARRGRSSYTRPSGPSPLSQRGGVDVLRESGGLQLAELIDRVLARDRPVRLARVRGSAGAFLTARLRARHTGPLLVVAPRSGSAERLAQDLRTYAPGGDVRVLPRYDTGPYDRFSPHPDVEASRMSLLYQLLAADATTPLTVVAPWSALLRRVLPRRELRERVTHLERGMTVDRDALLEVLVAAGYHHSAIVEERGEVASRGGILDLFPPQLDRPLRLEFDYDALGSIRRFDPATQRSDEELRSCVAIPPRPFRLPADSDDLLQRVRAFGRERGVPESHLYELCEALARRHAPPGIENLEPLLHEEMETCFDYLPEGTLVVVDDPEAGAERARQYLEEVFRAHAGAEAQDRLVCDPLSLYVTDTSAHEALAARDPVQLDPLDSVSAAQELHVDVAARDHAELRSEVHARRGSGRALEPLSERLGSWLAAGQRVRIACPSLSAADRMVDILRDYGHELPIVRASAAAEAGEGDETLPGRSWSDLPPPGSADVAVAPLPAGFELPLEQLVVVTEEDVFGERRLHRRPRRRSAVDGQAIDRLAQIEDGDYLVHAEHGIGRYGGLLQLELAGIRQEFLLVLYRESDKLYLPVSRLAQVQRYAGHDGPPPLLDRLGGQVWARAKRKASRAVRDMAEELLAVHAAREVLERPAYPPPARDYEEFEAAFPYEDTPDQRRATEEVLEDLGHARPMDRVVCGDVGFGKTEIACRAAYLVATQGRQVAFLVPTTVLCQQHLKTLQERFADTAIEVASLSRFSTPRELRRVREGLASGRIDIVVGTHRLLSKDVQLRNLGLLVIDEEHRFGVAHKERLKKLRKLVDSLTLTATPIPRTLQMALSGLRDLSVIATPPPERVSVRTQVSHFEDEVVAESIERERRRGGQVFFVHNRVETIGEIGEYVQKMVPDAKVRVAHGQMAAAELESVMVDFLNRDFDVLVCTAIIESGLDIPNANTILIHRCDRFGLAQLYQLRGRVGRSDRRAYCYLFLPPRGKLTDDAQRRIEAIQDLSELGAGFRLATQDLEIRGAGNLLGGEQSGHVATVGYDLYMEMLEEAIAELRGQSLHREVEPEIRLPIPALLPESFVASDSQRLVIYKQLSQALDDDEVAEIRGDLLDRFGPLPAETENLLRVIRLKIRCRQLGIESAQTQGGELVLQVTDEPRIDPARLMRVLDRPGSPYRVSPDHRIWLKLRRSEDVLEEAFGLLDLIAPQQEGHAA